MKAKLQIERIEKCHAWLETEAENYTASQSISYLINQIGILCQSLAFVNNQMAVAKQILNDQKRKAYNNLDKTISPMLAKEMAALMCSSEQYDFDVCERASKTVTHTLDALRTCISALKEELKTVGYHS